MIIKDLQPRTAAWHAWRQDVMRMASHTPMIMGLSPYGGAGDVYDQRNNCRAAPAAIAEAAMQHGQQYEAEALVAIRAQRSWSHLKPVCVENKINGSRWGASLDAFDGNRIVEIKCPWAKTRSRRYRAAQEGKICPDDLVQILHQQLAADVTEAYVAVFVPGRDVLLVQAPPLSEDAADEMKMAWDWYALHEESGKRPREDYPGVPDPNWDLAVSEYRSAKMRADRVGKELLKARDELVALSGGNRHASGCRVTTYDQEGRVDLKQVEARYGPLDEFRGLPSSVTRVTLVGEKASA